MKMNIKWLAPLLMVSTAYAEPTLYPTNTKVLSGITNKTTSNILADHLDDQTVWVMPPRSAKAEVTGFHSKTAYMGYCKEMKNLQRNSLNLVDFMDGIQSKRVAKEDQVAALLDKANTLNEEAEAFATSANLGALSDLDTRLTAIDLQLSDLHDKADKCEEGCDELNLDVKNTVNAKNQMLVERNKLAKQNAKDFKTYDQKHKVAVAAKKTYDSANLGFLDLISQLDKLRATYRQGFASFETVQGGQAGFSYTSDWDKNVAALREANPGINFSKIATKNAVLMTEIASIPSFDGRGAVMGINLGAKGENGVTHLDSYPEEFSTNVSLSLIGACPFEHPEYFDLTVNDVAAMTYGVMVTYDYESIFNTSASTEYNMYKMYEKIVSGGSSGGLFRSKSWSSVEEKNFFSDSFKVKWDDPENKISEADKVIKEQEMRNSIFLRIANMAIPIAPNRAELIAAVKPPDTGAALISSSLIKICPTNIYCQAGAAVAQVLNAIFGSSSSSASYKSIMDYKAGDTYSSTSKITKAAITSYQAPKKDK